MPSAMRLGGPGKLTRHETTSLSENAFPVNRFPKSDIPSQSQEKDR
jgi:hypothetical protein